MSEIGSDVVERFERMLYAHICPTCGGKMEMLSQEPLSLECSACGEAWEESEEPEDNWEDDLYVLG